MTEKIDHIAVILAGGQSRRMDGPDKALIDVGGQRLIDRVFDRISAQVLDVKVSADHDYCLDIHNLADVDNGPKGPALGLYTVWTVLKSEKKEGFFTVPVDGPNLPRDLCKGLYSPDYSQIASDDLGRHPTFAWWRMEDLSCVFKDLDFTEKLSLNHLANLCEAREVSWPGNTYFFNINTPADIDAWNRAQK